MHCVAIKAQHVCDQYADRELHIMSVSTATASLPTGPSTPAVPAPLAGGALALLTLGLALGTFMEVLDTSIANVAVPTISGSLGVAVSDGTWVISSYSVASAIAVPLTGWLARRVG